MNSLLLDDPNKAYTDAVVQALIEAMVDYSLPMVSSLQPEEYLTVAARDNERRDLLAPPNPYEQVSTFTLRIKAADLAAYRAGKSTATRPRSACRCRSSNPGTGAGS